MPAALPSIFAFTDFCAYLGGYYLARKASERNFSHRFIAEKVNASSSGWFSDVAKGRLNLAGAQLPPLAGLLRLKPNEIGYFEALDRHSKEERDASALTEAYQCNIRFFPLSQ